MYRILCYGDSNTWGFRPEHPFTRFPHDIRWTGVLRKLLGENYEVIEEGLNGRTTVWDDPFGDHKNGKTYLSPCLESHSELDLVIIMLGTNDLKARFSLPACDVAAGAGTLVDVVLKSETSREDSAPPVLLIAPPPLGALSDFAEMFEGGAAKSQGLSRHYRLIAEERGCAFLDAAEVIVSSDVDGIHFDLDEHHKLGQAVAGLVREFMKA